MGANPYANPSANPAVPAANLANLANLAAPENLANLANPANPVNPAMFLALKNEFSAIVKSPFLVFMMFVAPLFVGGVIYATFHRGIITQMPVGVVDLDASQTSRALIFDIDATATIEIAQNYASLAAAIADLSAKKIYALIVVPSGFERDVKTHKRPTVAAYYNAQVMLVGKNIQSALIAVFKATEARARFADLIAPSQNYDSALAKSLDFVPQIISLFNPSGNFAQFMLPVVLPCAWQLFIILCIISLVANDERDVGFVKGEVSHLRFVYRGLLAKIFINSGVFFAWWWAMEALFGALNYPQNGSLAVLTINALITIFAYNSIGIFIYALLGFFMRAVSVAAFYAAPSLAFVGLTFPVNSMEGFASFWSSILPITHYLQVYIEQADYGNGANLAAFAGVARNLPFLLFGILGFALYHKRRPI